MKRPAISGELTVEEMIQFYPETIPVLVRLNLHCVGCPISRHHTLAQVARDNEVALDSLLGALQEVAVSS